MTSISWTPQEVEEQQEFLDDAVRTVYNEFPNLRVFRDPHEIDIYNRIASYYKAPEERIFYSARWKFINRAERYRRKHEDNYIVSTWQGPKIDRSKFFMDYYTEEEVAGLLDELSPMEKQLIMQLQIRRYIDFTDRVGQEMTHRHRDLVNFINNGLSYSQQQELLDQIQEFSEFQEQQILMRRYVDPQEAMNQIEAIKQEAIGRMDLLW